ncbi:hypothetical protein CYY_004523 [Polysphondylium violaceum]|uniref:Uncharacterized protein n=1 Tax=Polysphondylium violaceum TaxID=133409 RepID=A0A8J4PWS1_9MYCE|nr:hypothetical protein CYY_004523 [Polysphondylium violaceum]
MSGNENISFNSTIDGNEVTPSYSSDFHVTADAVSLFEGSIDFDQIVAERALGTVANHLAPLEDYIDAKGILNNASNTNSPDLDLNNPFSGIFSSQTLCLVNTIYPPFPCEISTKRILKPHPIIFLNPTTRDMLNYDSSLEMFPLIFQDH